MRLPGLLIREAGPQGVSGAEGTGTFLWRLGVGSRVRRAGSLAPCTLPGLTLHVPEAGGFVGVVDGQADGSNVLQSLRGAAEQVVVGG